MYCNQTFFPIIPVYQTPLKASHNDSQFLLSSMARAVELKFKEYYECKRIEVCQQEPVGQEEPKSDFSAENVVIELSSEEQEKEESLKVSKQTSKMEEENSPPRPISDKKVMKQLENVVKPTPQNRSPPSLTPKEYTRKQFQISPVLISPKAIPPQTDLSLEMVQEEAEIPKLGIENAEILRRKEALLRRKVLSWEEVSQKGKNQRRELRMLQK